jgi:hypothetical protein
MQTGDKYMENALIFQHISLESYPKKELNARRA